MKVILLAACLGAITVNLVAGSVISPTWFIEIVLYLTFCAYILNEFAYIIIHVPTILPTYAHLKCRYLDYPVLCHGKHQFYERTASTHEKNASNYLVLFHPSFQKINTVFVCFFSLLWLSLYKQLQNIVPLIVSVHVQNPVLKICCSHLQVKTFLQRRWKIIIVPFIYSTTASFSFFLFFFSHKANSLWLVFIKKMW